MGKYQGPIAVGLLTIVAFVSGYKRDSLAHFFTSVGESTSSLSEMVPSTDDIFSSDPEEEVVHPGGQSSNKINKPGFEVVPDSPQRVQPGNPYEQMMNQVRKASAAPKGKWASQKGGQPFGGTLNSIKRDKLSDQHKKQRNAYFEKLSQQMKDLQGQKDAPASAPPAAAPIAQPEVRDEILDDEIENLVDELEAVDNRAPAADDDLDAMLDELTDDELIEALGQ